MSAVASPSLADAAAVLRSGGVLLHATEAVWGLACAAADRDAVARLYALKDRPSDKGLILVADTYDRVAPWLAPVGHEDLERAMASWPGPHTWVFPAAVACPDWLAGERGSIAVRVSGHPQVRALIQAFDGVLASTSANRSGHPPVTRLDAVDPLVRAGVDRILAGETGGLGRPTPVRDVRNGQWLRR